MLGLALTTLSAAQPVYFADANLKAAVMEALGLTRDPNTSDMLRLTELYSPGRGITDLTGLEYATNLSRLRLEENRIADISSLSGLTNLTSLSLKANQISSVSPLSGLTNLTYLNVMANRITDLSPLARLTNVTHLDVNWNQISDLGPLSGLTKLEVLEAREMPIGDISLLAGMANLRELAITLAQLSDISALAGLTRLQFLDLAGNRINDIRPLAGLRDLTWLSLEANQIADISPLAGLTNLTRLIVGSHDERISDITPLAGLTNLTELHVNGDVNDISPLAGLTSLTKLGLGYNKITDVGPLAGLTNLTWLYLGENRDIAEISALRGLTKLTYVHAANNRIMDISALSGLASLVDLQLYGNEVTDIAPLAGLANLTSLNIAGNQITDISPLAGLTQLLYLGIDANPIAGNISPLSSLENLVRLEARGNGISDLSPLAGLTHLQNLVLQDNSIADLSPLSNLTRLEFLQLPSNLITDLSPLPNLAGLRGIGLAGNQITDISILTAMVTLRELDLNRNPLPATVCVVEIPLIRENNPGIVIQYEGCPAEQWTLTVSASAGGSVVLPGEGQFQYDGGEVVTIEAVLASSSARFAGWTGSAVTAGKVTDPLAMKTTVVMDGDYDLQATFVEAQVPATGYSLGELSIDNSQQFTETVATNNTPERTFVEYVAGIGPDPNGMMRMQPVEGEPAVAKGSFGRSDANEVLVRFSYLFERATPGLEMVVYLSDVPGLLGSADPNRTEHYLEIGRVAVPPEGRPGAVGSGRFGVFEQWVSTGNLDTSGGLWVELELVESSSGPATLGWDAITPEGGGATYSSLPSGSIRVASTAAGDSAVLVDDWVVEVHCSGICMDLNWSDTADEEDFLLVIASCGRPAGLDKGGVGSRMCLDGAFSRDGYVDVFDIGSWDWALKDVCRSACGNFCRIPLPLVDTGSSPAALGWDSTTPEGGGATYSQAPGSLRAAAGIPAGLLILGKRQSTSVFKDGFYSFGEDANFLGTYSHAALSDRCNLRVVRGPTGQLCIVNSETGIVQPGGVTRTVIPVGRVAYASEPRHQQAATVYVGIQGASSSTFGRPVLDAAFDSAGYAYVVPVVVQPAQAVAYVAAAKLQLQPGAGQAYRVVHIYDDPPLPGDNQPHENLREIEVDEAGNVYVLNAQSLNEGDILFQYRPDGTRQRLSLTGPQAAVKVRDPVALHVSAGSDLVYLASAQRNAGNPGAAVVYGLATGDLSLQRTVVLTGLQQVTDMAEEPQTGRLYVVGFSMVEPVPAYPDPLAPPFYYPCLAVVPSSNDAVEAIPLAGSGNHDLVLPVSAVWTGEAP